MPKLSELPEGERGTLLRGDGLHLHAGPYVYGIQSALGQINEGLGTLYSDFDLADPADFTDYRICMHQNGPIMRLRQRVEFLFDNQNLFGVIERHNAYAFLEWGMNWCVSIHANEYLKLHAAVVAKNGRAIVMPGIPGAGKSTLCAALGLSGWRVLSDEHALIPPGTAQVVPLPRPVSLKNASIAVIKEFDSSAVLGPTSGDTHKGIVAHLKADLTPDSHDPAPLPVTTMVFPRYSTEEPQGLFPRSRSQSFILAAYHSFNYSLLGSAGFQAMSTLLDATKCYDLETFY